MDESAFAARLAETGAAIERELDILLGAEPRPGEPARPARLIEAMRYATLGGGKRLRPFLTVETARALGRAGQGSAARRRRDRMRSRLFADPRRSAGDGRRRPAGAGARRPTAPSTKRRRFSPATRCRRWRSRSWPIPRPIPIADVRAALCAGLARAIGLAGMVGGQMLDIDAERSTAPLSVAAIARLQAMKTGALLSFSVEAGRRLAGAGAAASAALSAYGRAIGAAFQIADDILDAEGDAATLGKRARKDAERNKATLVGALGRRGRAPRARAPGRARRVRRSTRPESAPRATCCARPRASSRREETEAAQVLLKRGPAADRCRITPSRSAKRSIPAALTAPPASPRRRRRRSQGRARS